MNKISKLFDAKSKEYNQIYAKSGSMTLLHQEKKIRASLVEEIVIHQLSSIQEGVVIDVGCGMGNVLLNLKEKGVRAKMSGVDISKDMISLANKKLIRSGYSDMNFFVGSLKDIRIRADVVLSTGVIKKKKNQEEFLVGLSCLVNSGGHLNFTAGNGDSFLRLVRNYLSKLDSFIRVKTKRNGVKHNSIKNKQVENTLKKYGFRLEKRVYMSFGLGLFPSSIECSLDRLLFKYLSNSFIGKYISLSVLYVYKKVES